MTASSKASILVITINRFFLLKDFSPCGGKVLSKPNQTKAECGLGQDVNWVHAVAHSSRKQKAGKQ
jgi:hypothetical protein